MSLVALVLLISAASAAGIEVELDPIDAAALEISSRTAALEQEARPGAWLSETEAITRFQDYLFLHMIGEEGPAAEGFFALVTTGALSDAGLHRDAEWYYAEALVGLGNYETAAARYQLIVDDDAHPFRTDAVRRLLESYAKSGDREAFERLYQAEIASGKVKPTGLITYSLAKGFHEQGDAANAASFFERVEPGNAWYGRARYFLGVMAVERDDLDAATTWFREVAALSVDTTEDRRVHDLALLALGRISYHRGEYTAASEFYNEIGGDSAYQPEKLYEIIWTSIRRAAAHEAAAEVSATPEDSRIELEYADKRYADALNNTEIFLLGYPEHQYAARLQLLQGQLNFKGENWENALGAYEQVIADYGPVQERFALLATTGTEADAAVRAVLEADASAPELPPYAVAMMRADPELARAMAVFRDLDRQRQDLEASQALIAELRSLVEGAGAVTSYERATVEAYTERWRSVSQRLQLLAVEERWLASLGDAGVRGQLPDLASRRNALLERAKNIEGQVRGANETQDGFDRQMASIHADADNARREVTATDSSLEAEREKLAGPDGADPATRPAIEAEISRLELVKGDAKARIADADARLAALVAPDTAPLVDAAELEALGADVAELAAASSSARPQRSGLPVPDRADEDHRVLHDSFVRLGTVLTAIRKLRDSEVGAIRDRFRAEVENVAVEQADYDRTLAEARRVSLALTREGFGRLEDFFAESVLKADMGIVDVYWAQKLEIGDELVRVREEKEDQLEDLERRFDLIRAKMGTPLAEEAE